MKKLVLIDGNALLHRAYHAYPPLTTTKGELVGAVYGFSMLLLSVLEKLSPTHVVVAWDVKGATFRKQGFESYKANRGPMDEELVSQIDRTKEVVEAMNIPQFGIEGYEADDLIGTIARIASEEKDVPHSAEASRGKQVVIVTGDRDSLQLIKEKKVVVYLPVQNRYAQSAVFDETTVIENYGMTPKQIIDLKGLMGDASDNIPGVKGIGKVTATELIKNFGSVEGVYENIDDSRIKDRVKGLLIADKEMALKSKELATIDTAVPLDFVWDRCLLSDYDKQKVVKLFEELDFKSLISKLPGDSLEKEIIDAFI